ncbi:MAG: carboxypeptidase-like regulatory domain-containing protein [Candidatus Poribacteria bacterium]|nr:carboxypeptidase-like regulatory domain-containing protein [Candidatus Poribacteria bacterium]
MNFPSFKQYSAIPAIILVLVGFLALLVASSHNIAQKHTSTLSGQVVNMEGDPIPGFQLAIHPIDIVDGEMWHVPTPAHQLKTDAAGHFQISDILPGHAQFVVSPETDASEADTEIHSVDVAGLSFLPIDAPKLKISHHPNPPIFGARFVESKKLSSVGGIPFYIKSGLDIKDITIKVRPRMRIRGKVLLADGTPLVKAAVTFNINYRSFDGVNSGNGSITPTYTDSEGYFVKYVNLPIFATVSVEYNGSMATSKTVKISAEQRRHDLVLRLSDMPIPDVTTPIPGDVQIAPPTSTIQDR